MDFMLALFIAGYLGQLIANVVLVMQIHKSKSIYGLCDDTQWVFFVATISRVFWMHDTRLTSFYIASFEVITNVLLSAFICYLCYKHRETKKYDTPYALQWYFITGACLVLSFFFHPGTKNAYYLTIQMLVSFSLFMECAGLLPQFLVMRKAKEVEGMTSHYIMCLGGARLIRLAFWLMSYMEGETFGYLILADLLHTILLGDFAFYYYKSIRSGKPILLS